MTWPYRTGCTGPCKYNNYRNGNNFCPSGKALPAAASEQVCLLHDAQELFFIHFSITIAVCLIDHFLKFLVRHAFAKLLCHALQVLKRNLACFVIIEQTEGFQNLILRVSVQDFVGHHLKEFLVTDGATTVFVNVRDHLLDFLLLGLKAERAHCYLQLLRIPMSRAVSVKEIEGLLDLLLLFLCEFLLFLPAGVEATQSHWVVPM